MIPIYYFLTHFDDALEGFFKSHSMCILHGPAVIVNGLVIWQCSYDTIKTVEYYVP